MMNGVLQVKGC